MERGRGVGWSIRKRSTKTANRNVRSIRLFRSCPSSDSPSFAEPDVFCIRVLPTFFLREGGQPRQIPDRRSRLGNLERSCGCFPYCWTGRCWHLALLRFPSSPGCGQYNSFLSMVSVQIPVHYPLSYTIVPLLLHVGACMRCQRSAAFPSHRMDWYSTIAAQQEG